MNDFKQEVIARIKANSVNQILKDSTLKFMLPSLAAQYSYNFSWLDRPIIQYPQDMVAIQEIIWKVRPDLIIETGIAHGGSLILSASMLALLDYCDSAVSGNPFDPKSSKRRVLGSTIFFIRLILICTDVAVQVQCVI